MRLIGRRAAAHCIRPKVMTVCAILFERALVYPVIYAAWKGRSLRSEALSLDLLHRQPGRVALQSMREIER
jgi:hypothetical protein